VYAAPFGTAFTYQGQLRQAGVPVNGTCDFQFSLFDAASGGSQIGATQAASGVSLTDGRFIVQLDFGAAFDGNGRWLLIATRCPAGSGGFTPLDPRQPLSPSPYALFATNAATSSNFSGDLAGDVTGNQGSTVVARLQGRPVVSTAPADGAVLQFNATANQWEPVVKADVNTTDFIFAWSATGQVLPTASFALIGLEQPGASQGISVNGTFDTFTIQHAGVYLIQYEAHPSEAVSAAEAAFIVTKNGAEFHGSESSTFVAAPPAVGTHISKSFLVQAAANDTFSLKGRASTTGITLSNGGLPAVMVTASMTMTRIQ
jgi:hypothetical protein